MKRVLLGIAAVLVLAIGACAVLLLTFDVNQYKHDIAALLSRHTNREIEIAGDIAFAPSLVPTVAVEGVRLGNAEWASAPAFVAVDRIEASAALLPLLERRIEVKRLALAGVDVALERDAQGRRNWTLERTAAVAEDRDGGWGRALGIEAVELRDVRVHYRDGASGAEHRIAIERLQASAAAEAAPLALELAARVDERSLRISGTIAPAAALFAGGPATVSLDARAGEIDAAIHGGVADPHAARGLDLSITLSAKTFEMLDDSMPPIGPVTVTATLRDGAGAYLLTDLAVAAGRSRLEGEARLALAGERPRIEAKLHAPLLDLAELLPVPAEDAPKPERLLPATPFPVAALQATDALLALTADTVVTRGLTLGGVEVRASLEAGRLRIEPVRAEVAGGTIAGKVALDASVQPPALALELAARGVVLGEIPALGEKQRVEGGPTDLDLRLKGRGASVAEAAAGGAGELRVAIGPARLRRKAAGIVGTDALLGAVRMLNPLAAREDATALECAALRFPIDEGIAANETGIGIQTDKLNILGGGAIHLADERIDIGARPKPRAGVGINLAGLADFVRIGGTLADPKPVTDAKGAATAGLKIGAAVATGGLSVLAEGLFDRVTVDEHVCAVALGEQPVQMAGEAPAEDEGVVRKTTEKAREAVQSAGDAVKGVFKGLFGD